MSSAVTIGGFKPVFHRCLVGFNPSEVLTFCSQVIRDFERTVRELEAAQHELQALKSPTDQAETVPDRVARILLSTERIADEIESRARTYETLICCRAVISSFTTDAGSGA
jgi:cell division septum initiation protein DivIVA